MLSRRMACLAATIPWIVVGLVTCTDDTSKTGTNPDSGAATTVVGSSECPENAPDSGDGCVLPEGTTCSFGTCRTLIAECTRGVWRFGSNVSAAPTCPADFPASDTACPTCFPADLLCNYGSTDCSAPDASTNRSVASCPSGTWKIATFPCSDASAETLSDAGADAGADVQGDGGLEDD